MIACTADATERMFMREIAYAVRGFLTVRKDSLRVPLSGSLTVHADQDSGLFTGDLVLHQSTISRTVLGASLFSATVHIEAESPSSAGSTTMAGCWRRSRSRRSSLLSTLLGGRGSAVVHATPPLRPLCRYAPSLASIWSRAGAWSAGTSGRPSPGAGGSLRLSTYWWLGQGTPSLSI